MSFSTTKLLANTLRSLLIQCDTLIERKFASYWSDVLGPIHHIAAALSEVRFRHILVGWRSLLSNISFRSQAQISLILNESRYIACGPPMEK